MAYGQKQLGELAGQLAEALDELALAVENFRIEECADSKVIEAREVMIAAIEKAQQQSRG
jgi:hypothetical protein